MRAKLFCVFFTLFAVIFMLTCEPAEEETYDPRADDDVDDDTDDDDSDDDADDDSDDDTDDDVDDDDDADDDVDDDTDDDTDDDVDDDCDDSYEPNDSNPGYYLGNMTNKDVYFYALIGSPYDIDNFYMWVDDPLLINFVVEAWLNGVPPTCNYNLYLYKCLDATCNNREIKDSSTNPTGEPEYVYFGGAPFYDDGGYYQVVVMSELGYECGLNYMLRVRGPHNKGENFIAN